MAVPRMFVSSTFYDLRYLRADLHLFERETGFELVLFERGNIPYDGRLKLEDSCLEEIVKCDIVVSIIGSRSGTDSKNFPDRSITRREVERAVELGRQLFVFVERSVLDEFETWRLNVDRSGEIKWRFVDSPKIFEFIEFIRCLHENNAIFPFDTSHDLMAKLREQMSGLFQSMLQQLRRGRFDTNVNALIESVEKLNKVTEFLIAQDNAKRRLMDDVLFSRHPVFQEIREALKLPIRIIFDNLDELSNIFASVGFKRVSEKEISPEERINFYYWAGTVKGKHRRVGVNRSLFEPQPVSENGNVALRQLTQQEIVDMECVVIR
jgi:hypothetical protein